MTPSTDQLLTAYALNELPPGTADHACVEAILRDNPAARDQVEATRAAAARLTAALATEETPTLTSDQRHQLLTPPPPPSAPAPPLRFRILRYALAAMVLLSVGIVIGGTFFAERGEEKIESDLNAIAPTLPGSFITDVEMSYRSAMDQARAFRTAGDFDAALEMTASARLTLDRGTSELDTKHYEALRDQADVLSNELILKRDKQRLAMLKAEVAQEKALLGEQTLNLRANSEIATRRRESDAAASTEINRLLLRARDLQKSQRYDEAKRLTDQAKFLDPTNLGAQMMGDIIEDNQLFASQRNLLRRNSTLAQATDGRLGSTVPYNERKPLGTYFSGRQASDKVEGGAGWGLLLPTEGFAFVESQTDHSFVSDLEPGLDAVGLNVAVSVLPSREAYDRIVDNPFLPALDNPLSTFSVDVDTASYANVRRFLLRERRLPPSDVVRIEELVNYFDYDYTAPADNNAPFAANVEVAAAPWQTNHKLVRIGLKGFEVDHGHRGPANLVFLLDVSGSMNDDAKLPLVKEGIKRLVGELRGDDRVAIVVYAGASGLVLGSTPIDGGKPRILDAIEALRPGGSTNGAAGIELAYQQATQHFIEAGVNRVILCTDGDFNVGITDRGQLTRLIEEKAKSRVYLTVLGFGTGNLQDATMEELARKGDGNYAYIDSIREAEKVLVEQAEGTLVAIAKDVKLQVEFNPAKVAAYRLIGYENRVLAKEDFNDDAKDAGDIGAGHTVTAFYEIIPATANVKPTDSLRGIETTDPLKYQRPVALTEMAQASNDLLTLKLRYKSPDAAREAGTSKLVEAVVRDDVKAFDEASDDFRFAAAVAGFGMVLRDSPHRGTATLSALAEIAAGAVGEDPRGDRAELIAMIRAAIALEMR